MVVYCCFKTKNLRGCIILRIICLIAVVTLPPHTSASHLSLTLQPHTSASHVCLPVTDLMVLDSQGTDGEYQQHRCRIKESLNLIQGFNE